MNLRSLEVREAAGAGPSELGNLREFHVLSVVKNHEHFFCEYYQ